MAGSTALPQITMRCPMNAKPTAKSSPRIVIRRIRRPKPAASRPSALGRYDDRAAPFLRLDPDAEPGRGRLGHCY